MNTTNERQVIAFATVTMLAGAWAAASSWPPVFSICMTLIPAGIIVGALSDIKEAEAHYRKTVAEQMKQHARMMHATTINTIEGN